MKVRFLILFLHCFILCIPHAAAAERKLFRFGVVTPAAETQSQGLTLEELLAMPDDGKLSFVVVNGIKSEDEPCSDELYTERKALFDHAKNAVIPSLTANDWTRCLNSSGKSAAVERLSRVRELFFSEKSSFGERKIPLIRQSIAPQFRTYSENSRWRIRNIMFATIHLPENNNNFIAQAGRNSEFEDRLISNRDWLQKLFVFAKRKKIDGIVLFSDGNPLALPVRNESAKSKIVRDGFLETRKQILKLAAGFAGKILVIHGQADDRASSAARIRWNRNLGELGVSPGLTRMAVTNSPTLFVLEQPREEKRRTAKGQR